MWYKADNTFKVLDLHSHSLGSIKEKLLSRRKNLFKEDRIQYSWADNELSFITVFHALCISKLEDRVGNTLKLFEGTIHVI